MTETAKCAKCGALLTPGAAPQGLCPRCLLAAAAGGTEASPMASDAAPKARRLADFEPPRAEDLGKHFPQLEILGLVGRGGMGAVYKARQTTLDRFVAIKILPPAVADDPRFAERFTREARALARLNHPNIVTIHEFGQAGQYYYITMEFVSGTNLRNAIRRATLNPREALAVVTQICDALQYAHEEGIVHRDIKPENILLDSKGRVKIADFGLAKLVGPETDLTSITQAGQVMGTPSYMAPEQRDRPDTVDQRADIYSLGVVFYEMLTGQLPVGNFQPPSQRVQVDVRLDQVVLHALEQEPERRYQQASQVKTDVESIAATKAPATSGASGASGGGWNSVWATLRNLRKSSKDEMLGGVCGGLGEHTPIPTWLWRALFVLVTIYTEVGLGAYILLWICLPAAATAEPVPGVTHGQPTAPGQAPPAGTAPPPGPGRARAIWATVVAIGLVLLAFVVPNLLPSPLFGALSPTAAWLIRVGGLAVLLLLAWGVSSLMRRKAGRFGWVLAVGLVLLFLGLAGLAVVAGFTVQGRPASPGQATAETGRGTPQGDKTGAAKSPKWSFSFFPGGCTAVFGVRGSGTELRQERVLAEFSDVELAAPATVQIVSGATCRCVVTGDDNLVPLITTTVTNGKLQIGNSKSIITNLPLSVRIEMPKLTGLRVEGNGDVSFAGVTDAQLKVEVDGTADVTGEGAVRELTATGNGCANLDLKALKAERVTTKTTGTGDIEVFASQSLKAEVSGAGDITYYGHPGQVSKSVSGTGEITAK
ncbi:MAG: hypothetical protein A3K18_21140 [Lentisphaerae bacterium RIFOXYA12_64_32]|nr:MAG: hypothetical protein A3K18_21140 [Lentisphaerae bacterium RIFOXYA12_64_32]